MSGRNFFRRFAPHGVFWRQFTAWGTANIPFYLEPMIVALSALIFFAFWVPGRRGVTRNMSAIFPGSGWLMSSLRAYRVFFNFAWTFADTAIFNHRKIDIDWEFEGFEHLQDLAATTSGAILLTAHMGNYDLGSYLFAEKLNRAITTVRAPEIDPETESYTSQERERSARKVQVNYNTSPTAAALELIDALRNSAIVAIQGDRVVPGVASNECLLFNLPTELPAGPFALAMTTRAPIYPLFVARVARRRYRVIAYPPFECRRENRNRDASLRVAFDQWRNILESTVQQYWYQWFNFAPFMKPGESRH